VLAGVIHCSNHAYDGLPTGSSQPSQHELSRRRVKEALDTYGDEGEGGDAGTRQHLAEVISSTPCRLLIQLTHAR